MADLKKKANFTKSEMELVETEKELNKLKSQLDQMTE